MLSRVWGRISSPCCQYSFCLYMTDCWHHVSKSHVHPMHVKWAAAPSISSTESTSDGASGFSCLSAVFWMVPTSMQYTMFPHLVLFVDEVKQCLIAETATYGSTFHFFQMIRLALCRLTFGLVLLVTNSHHCICHLSGWKTTQSSNFYKPCLSYCGHVIIDMSTDVYQLDGATTCALSAVTWMLQFPNIGLGRVEKFPGLHGCMTWHHLTYFFGLTLKL